MTVSVPAVAYFVSTVVDFVAIVLDFLSIVLDLTPMVLDLTPIVVEIASLAVDFAFNVGVMPWNSVMSSGPCGRVFRTVFGALLAGSTNVRRLFR